MTGSLHTELTDHLLLFQGQIDSIRTISSVTRRVDSLTLLCRKVLRDSSLCYIGGSLHHFDSRRYVPVDKSEIQAVLGNILVDMGVSPTDVRKMADMPLSVIIERSFDPVPVLCFTNGVLDLRDGRFDSSFPKDVPVTETMGYAYDSSAPCHAWEAFLSEVMPDPSERAVLQEFFGMVYLDRARISVEKFAVMVGQGANGKSVIFEVMKRVLGEDNVSTLDTAQLANDKMIPYVSGKRLNFSPDVRKSSEFDSALKALSSGQEVTGRKIFSDAEKVKCPPLCFALNDMPAIRDLTPAFFRRMLLFKFSVRIPPERQDRALVSKICAHDLPGIFNWIIAGRDRLASGHGAFTQCKRMDASLDALRGETEQQRYPVKAYLEGRGLLLSPEYDGQPTVLVSQNEIEMGLRSTVTRYAITAELRRFGVQTHRSKELFYKVYEKQR